MNKVINISSNGIKQAIDDLVNENELLQDKLYKKQDEIEQLKEELKLANESIIWWSNRYKAIEHLYKYTPEKGFELVGDEDVKD